MNEQVSIAIPIRDQRLPQSLGDFGYDCLFAIEKPA
jgi:hypothetical protein